ncbi:GvpL/GvpF family gas vesicle protein [Streptomyces sp. NBC_01591]|uniref:GvpL/GvpF family gas vesicle protein n=1 Tax=Streptomyces sp. NBC_01591 TaxID=2975888 RepID=UPI002DDB1549|nr:GvpL/GvpF family gas vesicle protein [Streptomyces sp. NBC_01591]WSD72111.1 GvpL/GvpF family gas vesicle protein [Streptomyces sp. NBC_01591]
MPNNRKDDPCLRLLPRNAGGVGTPSALLRTIRHGQVDAVVSEALSKLRARRRDVLAHRDLLLRFSDEGPVPPMRFGIVALDEETVRGRLAVGETGHVAALEYRSDAVEVNVKALPTQNALAILVAEDKKVRRLLEEVRRRPGYRAGLRPGEAVAAALENRAAEVSRRVLRELTPMARVVATGPDVQGRVLNVSFLVTRGDSDDFRSVAERITEAHREHVELRLAGPLPCCGFVAAEGTHFRAAGV